MYTENIFPCISWERSSLASWPRKKYRFFGKKIPSFKIIQERSCPGAARFEKTFFSEDLKKISYFLVFFWKGSSFIFRLRLRSYFRERETWSFPIIQERSYSNAIFLEKPSFQDVWKKKLWFSVQPLLASEKSSFSIFFVLKALKIIQKKKFENHSKPPKLGSRSLFKQFQQIPNVFLFFYWNFKQNQTNLKSIQNKSISESLFKQCSQIPNILLVSYWNFNPFAPFVQLEESQYRPTFGQQCLQNIKNKHCLRRKFFKEYSTSFLIVCRLIEFALVYLTLLVFKVYVIIGIL